MAVPLLDLKLQYEKLREPITEAMNRVAESQICILGPEVNALEAELCEYLGVKHAIGVLKRNRCPVDRLHGTQHW